MEAIVATVASIANDPAIVGLLCVAAADTAVGIGTALRDGAFRLDQVGTFLASHVLARVFPLTALLLFGKGNPVIAAIATAAVAAYVAETVASMRRNLGLPDDEAAAA